MNRGLLFLFIISACFLKAQDNYELDKIQFTGNDHFSAAMLKELIYSEETPPWYWRFLNSFSSLGKPPQYFDSTIIMTDISALKMFYNDRGFFKSSFDYSYEIDTISRGVVLTYHISEESAAQYGKIRFNFNREIPVHLQDKIYIDLNIDSSKWYSQEAIEIEISKAIQLLSNNGFMLAEFDSTIILRDTLKNRADVIFFIDPGYRYTISEIQINKSGAGSNYVSDRLLQEVAAIQPGEFYSREKIGQSQVRLFRTGLFNSISLSGNLQDTIDTGIPLRLSGNIGFMNELAPEIIMDNERSSFNLGLGASYIRRNFLGDARKFTLSSKLGIIDVLNFNFVNIFRRPANRDSTFQGFLNLTAKIDQPYVFNKPIFGSLEFYANLVTILSNTSNNLGGKLLFDFEMPRHTFITLIQPYYNIEFLEFIPSIPNFDLEVKIHSLTSVLGTELGSAKVNDIFFPSTGYNSSFLFEMAVSNTKYIVSGSSLDTLAYKNLNGGETAYFYKAQLSNGFYFPLNFRRTLVLAAKIKSGYIQTLKGSEELIPPNRTFFAGGSNSVRGWRTRELAPDDSIKYNGLLLSSGAGENVLGGTFLVEGSFEYRVRFHKDFGLTLFSDYGNVWNGYQKFRYDKFAVAAGFGIRYFSSIAPFRIDFGWKFYDPKDRRFIFEKPFFKQLEFHFGIGEAF